jgi:hypothetical protein
MKLLERVHIQFAVVNGGNTTEIRGGKVPVDILLTFPVGVSQSKAQVGELPIHFIITLAKSRTDRANRHNTRQKS